MAMTSLLEILLELSCCNCMGRWRFSFELFFSFLLGPGCLEVKVVLTGGGGGAPRIKEHVVKALKAF